MSQSLTRICIFTALVLAGVIRVYCQDGLPEVFKQGTIAEQLKYLDERTRIYENYRAIREDIYQMFSRNTLDTLKNVKRNMNGLILQTTTLTNRIDSLNKSLEATRIELTDKIRTKDSINLLGIEVNKKVYNSVMWIILGALVFLLIAGYLLFRLNRNIALRTKLDLIELRDEFEGYRQKTRLEREQMTRDHFNEIKKLKVR